MKFIHISNLFLTKSLLVFLALFFVNCFSTLKPPPITFTQTQTAAEKQLIGEDKEIERDGWLISSVKSSSGGIDEWKKEFEISEEQSSPEAKEYNALSRSLAYLAFDIKKYKMDGVIGENLNGKLSIINKFADQLTAKTYESKEKSNRVKEIVELTNENRNKVYQYRYKNEILKKYTKSTDQIEQSKNLHLQYYSHVDIGEYYEISKDKWIKKE